MAMRMLLAAACLLLSGLAWAGDTEYQRGDYKFSVGPVPAFVQRHEVPAQWDPKAAGADRPPWRFWLYERQADRRSGRDLLFTDYAYEVNSASLLGEAGRYQLDFNPGYQTLTIHDVQLRRGGQWQNRLDPEKISLARRETGFEKDMADGEVSALIVLDDVRVGDVVRIAFTVAGSNPILAHQLTDGATLSWGSPVLDSYLRVLADPGTQFATHLENGAPEGVVSNRADAAEIAFHRHGSAAIDNEDDYPVWYQPYPMALVSARRSWADVVAWALPLYPDPGALPADLESRIAEWSRLPTPRERLTAALRAVQDEVRYFGVEMGENTHKPAPPADTWRNRRGDCKDKAYLLSTILRRMDIAAVPALTSMDRGRSIGGYTPAASAFDHVIVRATLDGKPVWVDATMNQAGGAAGSTDLSRYGYALPVLAGTDALQAIAPPDPPDASGVDVSERLSPADGGKVALEVVSVYRGASANGNRDRFASARLDDISRGYADFYRKRYGQLQESAPLQVRDDRDSNTLTITEHYLLDSPFDDLDANTRALDVYADALSAPASLPKSMVRSGPLYLAVPGEYRHRIDLVVPKGWEAKFGRETEEYKAAAFDYTREVKPRADGVAIDYRMKVREYEMPAADVAAELKELRKASDNLSARLQYHVPASLDAGERDKRLQDLIRDAMNEGARK
ncbi:DUF3857 domain-containing protein [Pseudoluteimonas lycopersici]|uniref:DUF3857 domain-containing protein n=2 Tax=Pseudoluteimonas lycopersici TaxID=1324796 RepID=A0A516V534_9GAMM|nr:DUF3857 domain-containing protein [Lysobacter lycopersici]